MARLTVREVATLLEEVCVEYIPLYRDIPQHRIEPRDKAYRKRLTQIMADIGEQYDEGDIEVSITVYEVKNGQYKPWGIAEEARRKRNQNIVELRDEGLTFPAIGAKVGLTESGARSAYEKEKARQLQKEKMT